MELWSWQLSGAAATCGAVRSKHGGWLNATRERRVSDSECVDVSRVGKNGSHGW